MNFNGSLNFDGKPLSWIKKADGRVDLVFDGGPGDETVLHFSDEAFAQLTEALGALNGQNEIMADPKKGKVTVSFLGVDLERERVAIKGDVDSVELQNQLPTIIIEGSDGEDLLCFTFNKKQATDIERRLRNALQSQDCLNSVLHRAVIESA